MVHPAVDRLVLASASASRKRLLEQAGVRFEVVVSSVDEDAIEATMPHAAPGELALALARAKAEDVAQHLPEGALVLGCDSVLDLDGVAMGKPLTPENAAERWRHMRGRSGWLRTGHWLVGPTGEVGETVSTEVSFASVSNAEIEHYVATGEPLHVAGAFTLEGRAGPMVEGVVGDPSNVIGLSLPGLRRLCLGLGVDWVALLSD